MIYINNFFCYEVHFYCVLHDLYACHLAAGDKHQNAASVLQNNSVYGKFHVNICV